jgi:hypothetical protein
VGRISLVCKQRLRGETCEVGRARCMLTYRILRYRVPFTRWRVIRTVLKESHAIQVIIMVLRSVVIRVRIPSANACRRTPIQKLGKMEPNRAVVPVINASKDRVMDEIRILDKKVSSEILDRTITNSKAKDELITQLAPVITALFNFAKETNNLALKEKTRVTKSHLYRMLDKELIDRSEGVRLISFTHIMHLSKFGIRPSDVHCLNDKLSVFKNTLDNKVSSLISSTKVMMLSDLFRKADGIMAILDQFVESLEEEFTEFYEEYYEARDIENQDLKKQLMALDDDEEAEE